MATEREIYLAYAIYGATNVVQATVKETPKMYIVKEYEVVLGDSWWIHEGSHINKEDMSRPGFDSLYDALVWISGKLHGRREAKRKEVVALTEKIEMLEEMVAAL